MSATVYALYRYTYPDGRAKEWAFGTRADGDLEVRWGPAGRLVQRVVYPPARRAEVERRTLAKTRKGYVLVGPVRLDAAGRPVAVVRDPPSPPPRPRPDRTRIDLSALDTGGADYWF